MLGNFSDIEVKYAIMWHSKKNNHATATEEAFENIHNCQNQFRLTMG